ncbi:growth arrest-specific protein 7 isoform X1, partial [Arapaima gigas]
MPPCGDVTESRRDSSRHAKTTWERPSSLPGTPKDSLKRKNAIPAVNGFHNSGGPVSNVDAHQTVMRKFSADLQSPGSTSPTRKQNRETSVTPVGFDYTQTVDVGK